MEQLLGWRTAQRAYGLAADAASVCEQRYHDQKVRYDLGEASLDEVRTALRNWSTANEQTLTAQQTLHQTEQQMYLLLGDEVTAFTLPDPDAQTLQQLIKQIEGSCVLETVSPMSSHALKAAQHAAQQARITYEDIRTYDPMVMIGARTNFFQDRQHMLVTVSYSLSAQDFHSEQKQQAYDQLLLAERTASQQYENTRFAIEHLTGSLASSDAQLEITGLEIEQAESLLEESALLYELGTLSAAELEQSRNDLLQAEHRYYSILADRYLAIMGLRAYAALP